MSIRKIEMRLVMGVLFLCAVGGAATWAQSRELHQDTERRIAQATDICRNHMHGTVELGYTGDKQPVVTCKVTR